MAKTIDELIERINVEKDREKLYRWYQNGHKNNLPEIMTAALGRAIHLKAQGFNPEDKFENAVFHALAGYEIALSIKNDRRTAAQRTRELLKRLKPLGAMKYLMDSPDEKYGLELLTSMQLAEFTFESVVVTFPKYFETYQVNVAEERLEEIFQTRNSGFEYPKINRNLF